jgi:hypothetical protein
MKKLVMFFAIVGLVVTATGSLLAATWSDPFTGTGGPTWINDDPAGSALHDPASFVKSGGNYSITTNVGIDPAFGGIRHVASSVGVAFDNVYITGGFKLLNNWTTLAILGRSTTSGAYGLFLDPTDTTNTVHLEKTTSSSASYLAAGNPTLTVGTDYNASLSIIGSNLVAKLWKSGDPESGALVLNYTDTTSPYASGTTAVAIVAFDGLVPSGVFTVNSDHGNTFTSAAVSSVPEPASLFLLGSGLMGLGFLRKKKRV